MQTYVFDLDGTIVTNGQPVTAELGQALARLAETQQVIFSSARPVRDMLPLLPQSVRHCLMIGCNGGMAWQQGKWLFASHFERAVSETIIAFLTHHRIPYILDGLWQYSVSAQPHAFHNYLRQLSNEEQSEAEIIKQGVTKILILDGNCRSQLDDFLINQGYQFNVTPHKQDNFFDITPQKENKYLALQKLKINFDRTWAFGNDQNDFAMLDQAKTSIFLGDKADYQTADYYLTTAELTLFLLENLK